MYLSVTIVFRCEQCKRLAPIYEELAEMYKNDAGIVIAKMNSMANELEHTKITRFPTFKLYQKGDNNVHIKYSIYLLRFYGFNRNTFMFQVITFKGNPTLEGFPEFIDPPSKRKSVNYLINCLVCLFCWQALNVCPFSTGFPRTLDAKRRAYWIYRREFISLLIGHVSPFTIVLLLKYQEKNKNLVWKVASNESNF